MKKILFTGARNGIARAVIEQLKEKDYYIYLTVHQEEQLQSIQNKYQNDENIECFKLDITSPDDWKKVEQLDLDIFVSNAAIGEGGSIAEIDMDKVRHNFEVNVFSNFALIQKVLKKMIQKKHGKIIIMASLAGLLPMNFLGVYCATKASIIQLTTTLKNEMKLLKNIDIPIIMIEPGLYHTGFNQVMLENKYEWMCKDSLFKSELEIIRKKESMVTRILERKKTDSIVNKIVKAVEAEHPHFIYRAPFSQVFGVKLYLLLFK